MKIKVNGHFVWAFILTAVLVALWPSEVARAQDEGPLCNLKFTVLRDTDGKPVRNAQVILHPMGRNGKHEQGETDLKTNEEGAVSLDGIPYGTLRVQVMAPKFQTFGQDYEIDKPELEITVKLKHPADQYSIYGNDKKQ
jgi:hypothetical protein